MTCRSSLDKETRLYEMKEKKLLEQIDKLKVPDNEESLDALKRAEIRRENEMNRRKIAALKEEERNGVAELELLEKQMKLLKREKKEQVNHKQMEKLEKQKETVEKELNELTVKKRQKHLCALKLESKLEDTEKTIIELQTELQTFKSQKPGSQKELEKELRQVSNELKKQSQKTNELKALHTSLTQQMDPNVIDRLHHEEVELGEVNSILSVVERDFSVCSVVDQGRVTTIDSFETERSRAVSTSL